MDVFLSRVTQHAVNYAIRSGITITTGYAIQQCGRLLKETPRGSKERDELVELQLRLDSKIRIISPAIDMIELIAARGNTSLESAVSLTREIRYEIQSLGSKLDAAANDEQLLRAKSRHAKTREQVDAQLKTLVSEIKKVLGRIEDAVPLINLAITTSGVNLSTSLTGTVSPSRLLQASWFLASADTKYVQHPSRRVTVGPTYTLSIYMLFVGHARNVEEDNIRATTWKEVVHKAQVKLNRLPLEQLYDRPGDKIPRATGHIDDAMRADDPAEYAYQLLIIEDLDDDRVHTFEDNEPHPSPVDTVANAGIRDVIPVHEISKIFYADTGKILNIGDDSETNRPVLLLKRDVHAEPPRQVLHSSTGEEVERSGTANMGVGHRSGYGAQMHPELNSQRRLEALDYIADRTNQWRLPSDLDPEWIAFEVCQEEEVSDDDEDENSPEDNNISETNESSRNSSLMNGFSRLSMRQSVSSPEPVTNGEVNPSPGRNSNQTSGQPIKTTLSLLEMLLKLTALQQFRQQSHLTIGDELLNFFLEDSATAGSGTDRGLRQRLRKEAVQRVGFDPYDESPVKRRGEEYIEHAQGRSNLSPSPMPQLEVNGRYSPLQKGADSPIPSVETPRSSASAPPLQASYDGLLHRASHQSHMSASPPHPGSYAARMKAARTPSSASLLVTPPKTSESRQTLLRQQSVPGAQSPLSQESSNRD